MRPRRHWTPRYVVDRLRHLVHQRRHPGDPWLTAESVQLLDRLLRPTDVGFEWGSGRSTLWLAQRIRRLTSVESDPGWHLSVSSWLERDRHSNVELELREVASEQDKERVHDYVGVIDGLEDDSLDVILVDGLARDACALAAIAKLRQGGVLVVDDCHRYLPAPEGERSPGSRTQDLGPDGEVWAEFEQRTATWRRIWTSDGVSPTLLLLRANSD